MVLALFDLDGTLVSTDTDWSLVRQLHRERRISLGALAGMATSAAQHALGLIDIEVLARRVFGRMRGTPEHALIGACARSFAARVHPRISAAGREAIARHRAAGHTLVIATAANVHAARLVADELGVEHVVATELEVVERKLTGGLVAPYCGGGGKHARVQALAARLGLALGDAWFYSDSIADAPLLGAVGCPVAVDPDRRLRRLARRRGWPIERWAAPRGAVRRVARRAA